MSALLNSLRYKFEQTFVGTPKEECLKMVKWNHEYERYETDSNLSYPNEQAVAFTYMFSGFMSGYAQRMKDKG